MDKFKSYLNFTNFFAFIIFCSIYVYFYNIRDATINETYKNILLIITGFVFGSSKGSQNKDDTIKSMQETNAPVIGEKVENQSITVTTSENPLITENK